MKILTNKSFNDLMITIAKQQKEIAKQEIEIEKLQNAIKVLKNDKNILLNILNPDILGLDFPNSEERGLSGETDTPDNISDILSL